MKMLIAGGPRTLFEDQEDDLAALPSPAVPEYGPQHLRAKVVQTAFRVLLRELVSPMAPRGRESSMDWISIAILNSDQFCSPSIAIRT